MLIDQIVSACATQFTGPTCSNCTNTCFRSCEQCLDQIHMQNHQRRYNCPNIVFYYVCKYIYKYSSEIQLLFNASNSLKVKNDYNILSLGCGPCTDLVGIINFCTDNQLNKSICYTGIDLNDSWAPVNNLYTTILSNHNNILYNFLTADILSYLNSSPLNIPNILIMQYLISDMHKNLTQQQFQLILNQVLSIADLMPSESFIILNDINHNLQARDYFDNITASL